MLWNFFVKTEGRRKMTAADLIEWNEWISSITERQGRTIAAGVSDCHNITSYSTAQFSALLMNIAVNCDLCEVKGMRKWTLPFSATCMHISIHYYSVTVSQVLLLQHSGWFLMLVCIFTPASQAQTSDIHFSVLFKQVLIAFLFGSNVQWRCCYVFIRR